MQVLSDWQLAAIKESAPRKCRVEEEEGAHRSSQWSPVAMVDGQTYQVTEVSSFIHSFIQSLFWESIELL